MRMQCRSVAGRGSRFVSLATSDVNVVEVVAVRMSKRVLASKINGGFNGIVDVDLVVLIMCCKTLCQKVYNT
jgi:hypothetical protein